MCEDIANLTISKELSDEQQKQLHDIFHIMDSDGNGELSCEELFDYIDSRIDMVLDKEDMANREAIRDIVMETVIVVDKDGDGTISPKEMALAFFDELEGGIISIIDVVAKFASWFAFVDVDEDQLIDRDELQQFFMTQLELNDRLSKKECMLLKKRITGITRRVIKKVDADDDNKISIQEAVEAMKGNWTKY